MPIYPTNNHIMPAGDTPDCVWRYWSLVDMMMSTAGLYHMDDLRAEYHAEICRVYDLTREQTQVATDHMDKYETAVDLDLALRDIKYHLKSNNNIGSITNE